MKRYTDKSFYYSLLLSLALSVVMGAAVIFILRGGLIQNVRQVSDKSRGLHRYVENDLDGDDVSDLMLVSNKESILKFRAHLLGGMDGVSGKGNGYSHRIIARTLSAAGIPVPGDYDGDGHIDLGAYDSGRPEREAKLGTWTIQLSGGFNKTYSPRCGGVDGRSCEFRWGSGEDRAVPADFDGDGITDPAVFAPSTGYWKILYSSGGFDEAKAAVGEPTGGAMVQFGLAGDLPVVGDLDGDGKAEIVVVRGAKAANSGETSSDQTKLAWWIRSVAGTAIRDIPEKIYFGALNSIPLIQDLDGDGKGEIVVYEPPTTPTYSGRWLVWTSKGERVADAAPNEWGGVPVIADVDGDGKNDLGLFIEGIPAQALEGKWIFRYSSVRESLRRSVGDVPPVRGEFRFGVQGETPVTLALRRHQQQ